MTPTPKPQGFSDDELKRLKDALHCLYTQMEHDDRYLNIERHNINALLSRLEASEKALSLPSNSFGYQIEIEAWRRSKGE